MCVYPLLDATMRRPQNCDAVYGLHVDVNAGADVVEMELTVLLLIVCYRSRKISPCLGREEHVGGSELQALISRPRKLQGHSRPLTFSFMFPRALLG
jgi:hypothetical protein